MKIESRKLEWNAAPRTKMVNENYKGPTGGDKKVKKRQKTKQFRYHIILTTGKGAICWEAIFGLI